MDLEQLARRQHGLLTLAQCRAAGLSEKGVAHRVRSARWQRVHRGVYAIHNLPLSDLGRYLAAVLAIGADAALSRWSAAALWGIAKPGRHHPHVTAPRKVDPRAGIQVHSTTAWAPGDRARRARIPVTSLHRTIEDLRRTAGEEAAAPVIRAAERIHGYEPPRPVASFTRGHLERRFRHWLKQRGFADPEWNAVVLGYELDAYWRAQRIAVEIDDWDSHRTRAAFESDRLRDRRLAAHGVIVVRVTGRAWMDEALAADLDALGVPRSG